MEMAWQLLTIECWLSKVFYHRRSGILPLHVETGRFRNTSLENRLCTLCNSNQVENEIHFMFDCSLYDDLRSPWLFKIKKKCYLCTVKFITKCFELRKKEMYDR